jgi:hypothetical protein
MAELNDPRLPSRFWSKLVLDEATGCWQWTAALISNGYGSYFRAHGASRLAHKTAFEVLVGAVPRGLELDHRCRNRACVNPAHLEPVTRRENTMRGLRPAQMRVRNVNKTHCKHGHEYVPENIYVCPRGKRECKTCQRERSRKRQWRMS